MAESVKVAVRVRPFNGREKDRKAKCIIEMSGPQTKIHNPETPKAEPRTFAFDFSYWSHDSFVDNDGYMEPEPGSNYASQLQVFEDLGKGVLNNAYEGYNTSLFAYGQTGAGKSYSMVGYGKNKGIVPITCDNLFQKITSSTDGTKYEVKFSMLEIYSEQVRDLLSKTNPKGGLPVRENPKLGLFYVGDLKKVAVGSYEEIDRRIEEGTANRTVASTQMNATSSRAHTVVTIEFTQKQMQNGAEMAKQSVMNLVDLAGSERAESTGATGDRLKEGAAINKSLSALGNVISALADLSTGKGKGKVRVPYRDSALTKLLMNALGGNSKTIMIAAVSPADINYDESLGTLRYADRAKKIKNKATVNENPIDKLIRELREENEKLKQSLGGGPVDLGSQGAGMSEDEKAELRAQIEAEYRAQIEANAALMNDNSDFSAQLQASRSEDAVLVKQAAKAKEDLDRPRLTNLNEDPMLSGVVHHYIATEKTIVIGRKDGDTQPDIVLTGLGVQKNHASVTFSDGAFKIAPGQSNAKVKVNGKSISSEHTLHHKDRVVLGSNHLYVFHNPTNPDPEDADKPPPDTIDWEFAQKELAEHSGFSTEGLSAEQARVQERVLELLPMISEVNAVSEELNKYRHFELVLLGAATQDDNETKVVIQMKDLNTGNLWLWERDKFVNRRYMMQEMYQQYLDEDETWKTVEKDQDPFWDAPEDYAIGSSSAFLQSLSYGLDFEDKLMLTDHRGHDQGSLSVVLTPCSKSGKPLGDEFFVEDPKELLDKEYYVKVDVRSADINNTRFTHGLYVQYGCGFMGEKKDAYKTKTIEKTLSPTWNNSRTLTIEKMTEDVLDKFESEAITFTVYGLQVEGKGATSKMTTRELKEKQGVSQQTGSISSNAQRRQSIMDVSKQSMEVQMLQKRLDLLSRKEARIQELCKEHSDDVKDKNYKKFYDEVTRVATSGGNFKKKVKMLTNVMKLGRSNTKNPPKKLSQTASVKSTDTQKAPETASVTSKPSKPKSKACSMM